jgi:hypothetical protein
MGRKGQNFEIFGKVFGNWKKFEIFGEGLKFVLDFLRKSQFF